MQYFPYNNSKQKTKVKCKKCAYFQEFEGWTFDEAYLYMQDWIANYGINMKCLHELEDITVREST